MILFWYLFVYTLTIMVLSVLGTTYLYQIYGDD